MSRWIKIVVVLMCFMAIGNSVLQVKAFYEGEARKAKDMERRSEWLGTAFLLVKLAEEPERLAKIHKDGWGRELQIMTREGKDFLTSSGPDGKFGTGDDLWAILGELGGPF